MCTITIKSPHIVLNNVLDGIKTLHPYHFLWLILEQCIRRGLDGQNGLVGKLGDPSKVPVGHGQSERE